MGDAPGTDASTFVDFEDHLCLFCTHTRPSAYVKKMDEGGLQQTEGEMPFPILPRPDLDRVAEVSIYIE